MCRPPVVSLVSAFFLLIVSAAAAAPVPPACQAAIEAQRKAITTPHHTTSSEGNPPTMHEAIAVGGVNYIKVRDEWKKSPLTPQDSLDQLQENIKDATALACTTLPDGDVDGAPATVYKVHTEAPAAGVADLQLWLSKTTGLLMRVEEDLHGGRTMHLSVKYDYANVKAPVVK
jgi:hypothetical protein